MGEPLRISFLLRLVYNLLPSPANLHRWGLQEHPVCQLCDKTGTMEHILSACTTALTQGRYRWRHDSVLQELADKLARETTKKRTRQKEGQKAHKQKQHPTLRQETDIWSNKCLVMVGLIVPWETRSEEAYERKKLFITVRTVQRKGMVSMALPS